MNHNRAHRRAAVVAAALVTGLLATATPALADNPPGIASVGAANFVEDGDTSYIADLAQCAVDGTTYRSTIGKSDTGVKFGPGYSTCTTTVVDPEEETTSTRSEANGTLFELSALVSESGPRLKVGSWRSTCSATQGGTTAGWSISGLSGFTGLPAQIPANYVLPIKRGTTVLATATFSEITLPNPNDGSLDMNLLHIRFTPASGITGDVVLGHVACSPTP
ncbi:hypothetical protein GCM10022243_61510 [Saccharothrix violaceirubra]|uniref:Secreted protein n=1 Tax=Saccharothrix violaceirubra TaxID=413306 RepID=A0A7W7T8V4_9PSEU|nr:hypothetical protein [Saccharothrix violaceirubra]MBB4968127.1 hypothetical protein [Saccharothrix violaceirubra]